MSLKAFNEIEAQQATGVLLRDQFGVLITANIPVALSHLIRLGVKDWAVIHAPEGGYGIDNEGQSVSLPGLKLPDGYIRSTTGAGDAFCSGVL